MNFDKGLHFFACSLRHMLYTKLVLSLVDFYLLLSSSCLVLSPKCTIFIVMCRIYFGFISCISNPVVDSSDVLN